MKNPLHSLGIMVISGSMLAQTIGGKLGITLGFVFGLIVGGITIQKSNPLQTDVDRILKNTPRMEALVPMMFLSLAGALLFSLSMFDVLTAYPMAETICTSTAFLVYAGAIVYLFMNG